MNNPAIEPVAKKYAELRYQLMPYTYTLACEARDSGTAADARDVAALSADDERARGLGTQYLWGRDLLVAPVFTKGATTRDVYLPGGRLVRLVDEAKACRGRDGRSCGRSGDDAHLRPRRRHRPRGSGSAIHGRGDYGADDTARLPGANGQFTLYEDDGISQEYLNGRGSWTRMTWNDAAKQLTLEAGAPRGAANITAPRTFKVQLLPEGTRRTSPTQGVGCR